MKNNAFFLLLTIIIFQMSVSYAQLNEADKMSGKSYSIDSKILSENREIQVYVPESYHGSKNKYAVLYLLDGQRLFHHGVSLAKTFTQFNTTPEFIVIGISNKYPDRFSHFSSKADSFLKFIEEEVFPIVEANFRVTEERLLFGWEYGGGFVINTLIKKGELFNAYIAASAYPLSDKIQKVDSLFSYRDTTNRFLYFSSSINEGVVMEEATMLKSLLEEKPSSILTWKYKLLKDEEHHSTPFTVLYHGVKNYYYYYPVLQFVTFDEFVSHGGIDYVVDYYEKRASQFGFSSQIPLWTKFSIIRSAIRADNYGEFIRYAEEFINTSLINNLRNNQPYSITDYYLKNKNYDKAIEIYQILLEKNPDSVKALNELGNVFMLLKDEEEANKYYNRAKRKN